VARRFLGLIVAHGRGFGVGPRPIAELEDLAQAMERVGVPAELSEMLWLEAAEHVEGRTGTDLAVLLGKIERKRPRRNAELGIARKFAAALLGQRAVPGQFVQYVRALRDGGPDAKTAVFLACKELADPEAVPQDRAAAMGILAQTAVGLDRDGLLEDAMDLLERCMEDEQRMTSADMCVVVGHLTRNEFPEADLETLLQNTLGRWSDTVKRENAVSALQEALREPHVPGNLVRTVTALR
jgi:hypothetical protein